MSTTQESTRLISNEVRVYLGVLVNLHLLFIVVRLDIQGNVEAEACTGVI